MQLAVEISLYPLNEQYIEYIKDFIQRLNNDPDIYVNTSATSTLISGEYDHLMRLLSKEMKASYAQLGQAIFVCKFLNADNMNLAK